MDEDEIKKAARDYAVHIWWGPSDPEIEAEREDVANHFTAGVNWVIKDADRRQWVYAINSGSFYEGGGAWGNLYATEELARIRFNQLLQKKEEEYRLMCEFQGGEYRFKWKKEEDDPGYIEYWSNGIDYLAIDRMEVVYK